MPNETAGQESPDSAAETVNTSPLQPSDLPVVQNETSREVAQPSQQRGLEDEDPSDLMLPRIELLQSMSPTVQQGNGIAGTLVNQISKSPLSTDIIIPIAMHRKFIKWIPRDQGGGIEYQTNDARDSRVIRDTKWGPGGEKPSCTKYLNFLVLLEGETLPIVLSFSMTNFQVGRKLYTMAKTTSGDIWNKKYKLSTQSRTNNMGTFFVFDVMEAGDTGDADRATCEALYNTFSQRELNFEVDSGRTTTASANANEDF